jgi:hypothetical protein
MDALSLLNPTIKFLPEEEVVALARYTGFASDLFPRLYAVLPSLRGRFRFFRDPGTDDLWSVCEVGPHSFGLQLDPDIEVICLWDVGYHEEVGCWPPQLPDPVDYAINKIHERYLPLA